jgi:hypothetical protein
MRFLLFLAASAALHAATPQERAIRRLEKAQHEIIVAQHRSEKRGAEAQAACQSIGKTLQVNPLGVLDCMTPPAPPPPVAPPPPPAPAKVEPAKPEAPKPEPAKP